MPPSTHRGQWEFVNYGIEDADELCAAVAPSGSYKIPLKGFVPGAEGGSDYDEEEMVTPSRKKKASKRAGADGAATGSPKKATRALGHKKSKSDLSQ